MPSDVTGVVIAVAVDSSAIVEAAAAVEGSISLRLEVEKGARSETGERRREKERKRSLRERRDRGNRCEHSGKLCAPFADVVFSRFALLPVAVSGPASSKRLRGVKGITR